MRRVGRKLVRRWKALALPAKAVAVAAGMAALAAYVLWRLWT